MLVSESWSIPEGTVVEVRDYLGNLIWKRPPKYNYVSLGDSIAAGHAINADWENDYGTRSQYGEAGGNPSTVIVEYCYTDLIRGKLEETYGSKRITAVSFAHSGDTVEDLMKKLEHKEVADAIGKANLVTVCIGANDVLGHVTPDRITNYILNGDKSAIESGVQNSLAILDNDSDPNSYLSLLKRLTTINPNATFVFTTVYNPYKYVHLDKSTAGADYKDGFLGPLMWSIPDALGSLAPEFRKMFIESSALSNIYSNVNAMSAIVEEFVSSLNDIIRRKIQGCGNANIILADTKAVFDPVPDRPISAPRHYNDLVNVEVTSGYVIEDLDWGQFWGNLDWSDVATNIGSSSFFEDLVKYVINNVINNVIIPDMDPHPEEYGQYALKCSFADALGWSTIPRYTISYNANGGTGSMASQVVIALDGNAAFTNIRANGFGIPSTGYRFVGWKDGNGNSYSEGQIVGLNGDLTLNAQWSNTYTLTLICEAGEGTLTGSDRDTGVTSARACYVGGVNVLSNKNFGTFKSDPDTKDVVYGTTFGALVGIVSNASGKVDPVISGDGATSDKFVLDASIMKNGFGRYFAVTADTTVRFVWRDWRVGGINVTGDAYWDCYITNK